MKKISICAMVLLSSFAMSAQNKKGNWIIGTSIGGMNIGHSNGESGYSITPTISKSESNSFSISLNPSVGFYLSDDIVVGAEVGIGFYSGKSVSSSSSSSVTSTSKTSYFYPSLGTYGRFYLGKSKTSGMPFVQGGASIQFYPGYESEYTTSNGSAAYTLKYENYSPWSLYGRVGYEHFINTILGIQYYIGYSHSATKYDYTVDYTAGGTDYTGYSKSNGGSFIFGAGILIHLNRNKGSK